MVNANNSIILISDFDTDEDVKDITIQNNTYLIGV
jgi:predicted Zn-dependent protease with MMP-like domain